MNILPKIILGPDPLVLDFPTPQHFDQHPNNLGPVELVTRHPPGVIAQVVEDPEVPWGEDELDAVLDRLRFGRSGRICRWQIGLPHLLGPAEDVIPASGERIFAQGLLIHAESPPQQDSRIPAPRRSGDRSRKLIDGATGPHPASRSSGSRWQRRSGRSDRGYSAKFPSTGVSVRRRRSG